MPVSAIFALSDIFHLQTCLIEFELKMIGSGKNVIYLECEFDSSEIALSTLEKMQSERSAPIEIIRMGKL